MTTDGSSDSPAEPVLQPEPDEAPLPALRNDIDIAPSADPDRPGWTLRDPMGFTEAVLLLPPPLAPLLALLDGQHDTAACHRELAALLSEHGYPGAISLVEVSAALTTLRQHGFLQSEEAQRLRQGREERFRALPVRLSTLAGRSYPADAGEMQTLWRECQRRFVRPQPANAELVGVAAPHLSPQGGYASYTAAFTRLAQAPPADALVLLGTSHYGALNRFGLTRKPYQTPLGALQTDVEAIEQLLARAPGASVEEDYCHAVEHSLEFQCAFAHVALSRPPSIVPILCGALDPRRRDWAEVERFLAALRTWRDEMSARDRRVQWLLGIDLSHIGQRYGDEGPARVGSPAMRELEQKDVARLRHVLAGDAGALERAATPPNDPLRWCGYSPLYVFLRLFPGLRGDLLHYEQWQIDAGSVVSCAALSFTGAGAASAPLLEDGEGA